MTKRRLLITDPYTPQSYDIILGLQEICERIVITVPPLGRFRRIFCFTGNSKLVSKVYLLKNNRVGSTTQLFSGQVENIFPAENEYVKEIMAICEHERIDLIYPSDDDEVVLLSKYARIFRERGVTIPVNKYEVLRSMLDKFNIIKLAHEEMIPCPETSLVDIDMIFARGKQLFASYQLIKPRYGSAARGISLIRNRADFEKWFVENGKDADNFIIQEYIPGDKIIYFRIYMKSNGEPLITSCAASQRPEMIIYQSRGLAIKQEAEPAFSKQLVSLFRKQKFVGCGHVQLKLDKRDGIPKLMEVNARIGRGAWTEMHSGLNSVLISLHLFDNREIALPKVKDTSTVIFVWPIQDICILALYCVFVGRNLLQRVFRQPERGCKMNLPGVKTIFAHYLDVYFSVKKKRIPSNYYSFFLRDPLVSLSYWLSFCYLSWKESK